MLRRVIRFLHIDNHWSIRTVLVKTDLQTSIFTRMVRFSHNIHREALCGEGDGVVGRGDRGHELVSVGALMIDVQQLAVRKVGVGNGDHHRLALQGLPLGIAIADGNVVGALHLLALGQGALHLGGLHLRLGGHLAHHLKVSLRDLLLDRPRGVMLALALGRHVRREHHAKEEHKSKDRQQEALHFLRGRCTCHTFIIFILY